MRLISCIAVLLLLLGGCTSDEAGSVVEQIQQLDEAENPSLAIGRDALAAALRYDIDTFVERNRPKLEVVFLSILGSDPADELLERLEGTALEVRKFSEWTTYFKNEQGQPVMPKRFFLLNVRDVRIVDSAHIEVDTAWDASGIKIPGETFYVESIEGTWRVIDKRVTPPG
jgi:hypothetical protein